MVCKPWQDQAIFIIFPHITDQIDESLKELHLKILSIN